MVSWNNCFKQTYVKKYFSKEIKKKIAFYLYKYFLLSVITILDLDKYTKHKNKYNLKIEEKSVVVIFIPFFISLIA